MIRLKIKNLCYSFLASLLILKGYDKVVDGFYLYKITTPKNLSKIENLNLQSSCLDLPLTQEALNQPYYYLASGSQCFVFVSQDKKFVLKFFNHHRWKTPQHLGKIPLPFTTNWIRLRQEGLRSTYKSCCFCINELSKETAVINLELMPNQKYSSNITLYNRLGKRYDIALNSMTFILQKHADSTAKKFLKLKAAHEDQEAKQLLDKLFDHLISRRLKGFTDKDPNLLNNFGLIDNQVVSIDIGGLIKDPKKDLSYFYNHELKKVARQLMPWLKKNYPELTPYADEKIALLKKESS